MSGSWWRRLMAALFGERAVDPTPLLDRVVLGTEYDVADFEGWVPPGRSDSGSVPAASPLEPARMGSNAGRGYQRWTSEDEAVLRRGHAQRMPVGELAALLGRSRSAVANRLLMLAEFSCPQVPESGVEPGSHGAVWSEAEDAALVEGWRSGLDSGVLAGRLGRSQKSVQIRLLLLHEVDLPASGGVKGF